MLVGSNQTDPVASSATDVVMDEVQAFKAALAALNSIVAQAPEHLEAMFSEVAQGLEAGLKDAESEIVNRAKELVTSAKSEAEDLAQQALDEFDKRTGLVSTFKSAEQAWKDLSDPKAQAAMLEDLKGQASTWLESNLQKYLDPATKGIVDRLLNGENPLDLLKDQLTQSWDPQTKGILDTLLNGGNPLDLLKDQLTQMWTGFQSDITSQFGGMWNGILQQAGTFEEQWKSMMQTLAQDVETKLVNYVTDTLFDKILWPAFNSIFNLLGGLLGLSPTGGVSYTGGVPLSAITNEGVVISAASLDPSGAGGSPLRVSASLVRTANVDNSTMALNSSRSSSTQALTATYRPQELRNTTVVLFDRKQLSAMRTSKDEVVNYVTADLFHNGPIRQSIKRLVR